MALRLALSLSLFLVARPLIATGQAAPTRAWFLDYTWTPDQDSLAGLPVKRINSGWDKALALSPALFPPLSHDDSLEATDYIWTLGADLNQDGRRDSVLTGVFAGAGGTGRFLLVLSRDGTGGWQSTFLRTTRDGPGFSALSLRNGHLFWLSCMSCGNQSRLIPTRTGFRLKYEGD
jgi:hypothetical protein